MTCYVNLNEQSFSSHRIIHCLGIQDIQLYFWVLQQVLVTAFSTILLISLSTKCHQEFFMFKFLFFELICSRLLSCRWFLTELKHAKTNQFYNITRAKRALWLANSASTICPWALWPMGVCRWRTQQLKQSKALCDVSQFVAQHFDHCNDAYRCRQEYRPL